MFCDGRYGAHYFKHAQTGGAQGGPGMRYLLIRRIYHQFCDGRALMYSTSYWGSNVIQIGGTSNDTLRRTTFRTSPNKISKNFCGQDSFSRLGPVCASQNVLRMFSECSESQNILRISRLSYFQSTLRTPSGILLASFWTSRTLSEHLQKNIQKHLRPGFIFQTRSGLRSP